MKHLRPTLGMLAALAVATCDAPNPTGSDLDGVAFQPGSSALFLIADPPAVCSEQTEVGLLLGPGQPVGTVEVSNNETHLYVRYRTDGGSIQHTALFVGDSAFEIPTHRRGTVRINRFPYQSGHARGTNDVVWEVPLSDVGGDEPVIVAYAQVDGLPTFGDGSIIIPDGQWATYITYPVDDCAVETVGSGGGTVSHPGGEASITIPAGALSGDVDITIDPSNIDELLDHVANRPGGFGAPSVSPSAAPEQTAGDEGTTLGSATTAALAGSLPHIGNLEPIANTIWDFGPDGTHFDLPSTVVLKYDEADLPTGLDEAKLGVFLINGVIPYEPLPSVVDPVTNTIRAEIEHFSFVFVGFVVPAEADLSVSALSESADPIELGQEITYEATVRNFGPDPAPATVVWYLGFGDIQAGTLDPACENVIPPFPAQVKIQCTVGDLDAIESLTAPPASFLPGSTGQYTVWVDPGSEADDPNVANNRFEATFDVAGKVADLSIQGINDNPDPAETGENVTYFVDVSVAPSTLQTVVGARLLLNFSDATFVTASDPACFSTLFGVTCPLPPLGSGIIHGLSIELLPDADVSELSVTARVEAPFGTTDPDPTNNFQVETTGIGVAGTADLSVFDLTESADPIELGQEISFNATLRNFGPDPAPGAVVYYLAFGDVQAGTLHPSCENIIPAFPAQVNIRCAVGDLSANGISLAAPAAFLPQRTGEFTIWVDPGSDANDPNIENNRFETTYEVVTPVADLSIQTTNDSPDPASPGEDITYFVHVALAPSTLQTVDGATLLLDFTGASFVSASESACFSTILGVTCPLPPLGSGIIEGVDVVLRPDAGSTGMSVNARVQAPFGTTDPDLTNNSQIETTTITATELTADLAVQRVADTPDPVSEGGEVTYEIDVVSLGATQAIEGAVLQLLFTGAAQFQSSTLSCTPITGGVVCALGTLSPDVVATEQVIASLPTSGDVTAEARVVVPAGVDDPDLTNNQRSETTTVQAGGPQSLTVGTVIEIPGPTVISGEPPDTAWYSFETTGVGEVRRVHLSRINPVSGFGQLLLFSGDEELFPDGVGGRATDRSSANEVFTLAGAGTYSVGIAGSTGPYRLGLGDHVGRPDASFGLGGLGIAKGPTRSSGLGPVDMALMGGDIVTVSDLRLTRFDDAGSLVTTFGAGGEVDLVSVIGGHGRALAVQPDGKIIVAASNFLSPYPWIIARFDTNGSLDTTFGTGGITSVNLGGNRNTAKPVGIGFYQDGAQLDIVVGGHAGGLAERMGLTRLNPDGSIDTAFGTNGIVFEAQGFDPQRMGMQSDGSILLVGFKDIARYTSSGALDTTFGTGGVLALSVPTNVHGMAILPDDDILLLGEASNDAYINRLTPDGAFDTSFQDGGYATYDFGLRDRFIGATQTASGDLLVVGHQVTTDGDKEFLVTRMSGAGALDMTFGHAGYILSHRVDEARKVFEDSLGRVLVGGSRVGTLTGVELMRLLVN